MSTNIATVLGMLLKAADGMPGSESPSLDRIDPTGGYTPDNIRVISYRANWIKNDGTLDEHQKIAAYMESNLPNKKD